MGTKGYTRGGSHSAYPVAPEWGHVSADTEIGPPQSSHLTVIFLPVLQLENYDACAAQLQNVAHASHQSYVLLGDIGVDVIYLLGAPIPQICLCDSQIISITAVSIRIAEGYSVTSLKSLFEQYDELTQDVAHSRYDFFQGNLQRWFTFLRGTAPFAKPILQQLETAADFKTWFEPISPARNRMAARVQ
jgi:hypothetical protein